MFSILKTNICSNINQPKTEEICLLTLISEVPIVKNNREEPIKFFD